MKFDFSYSGFFQLLVDGLHCIKTVEAPLLSSTSGKGMWDLVTPSRRLARKQN